MVGEQVVVELVAATIEAQQRCKVWSSRRPPDVGPYDRLRGESDSADSRAPSRRGAAQMDGSRCDTPAV
jgi:hypothetical protein